MKAIINGAGIAGLTLATLLDRNGWDVVIVEKAPSLRDGGYMIDFMTSGYDAAEQMGLLPKLEAASYVSPGITWVDGKGRDKGTLKYSLLLKSQKGRFLNFMRGDLERILFENLPPSVEVVYGASIQSIDNRPDGAEVTLSNGRREQADLVVGADGIHSKIREMTFGPEKQFIRPLGFKTAAYIFEDKKVHKDLNGSFKMLCAPNRQMTLYALEDNKVAAFFVHRDDQAARPSSVIQELNKIYGDMGWHVPAALEKGKLIPDIYYDDVAQVELPQWHKGRVVLVGDAAYAVSLLAGQGASLAMGGAFVLAQELGKGDNIDQALKAYQEKAHPKIKEIQKSARKLVSWFLPSSKLRLSLRNAFVRASGLPGVSHVIAAFLASGTHSIVPPAPPKKVKPPRPGK